MLTGTLLLVQNSVLVFPLVLGQAVFVLRSLDSKVCGTLPFLFQEGDGSVRAGVQGQLEDSV